MITADQPTIFPGNVKVAVSSRGDGNMSYRLGAGSLSQTRDNQWRFIESNGSTRDQSSLVFVKYEGATDFCRYRVAPGINDGIRAEVAADALATADSEHSLFLPLADCCGLVLYDPANHALMLSHLGRHSVEQYGARRSVEYMQEIYQSQPADLLAWLSPAAGGGNYPVFARDSKSLHELISKDLLIAGVQGANIEASSVDTTTSGDYFSHSEWQKGNREADGRFAVLAYLQ